MITDQIKSDITAAMRSHDGPRKDILRVALGEMQRMAADKGACSDEDASGILRKIVKSNIETIASASDAAMRERLQNEITIMESYLPKTMTQEEIRAFIKQATYEGVIAAAKSDGQAVGVLMKHMKSCNCVVNGADVKAVVEKIRSGAAA